MKEEWRSIVGYEGLYEVSNQGKVKSLERMRSNGLKCNERILKEINHLGYILVTLCKDGKQRQFRVHRLVAMAFIPNPENKDFIDHINTIRNDNRVENLRWVTRQENRNNPISVNAYDKAISRSVMQYDTDGNLLNVFASITEASKKTGVKICAIQHGCSGRTITSKGYIWRYKEDADSVMVAVALYKNSKTTNRKIEVCLNGEVKVFNSMSEAARELKMSRDTLRKYNHLGDISWKKI